MFSGCTSLTEAPALPATELVNSCYSLMFSGCTSLTSAPDLLASTPEIYCYWSMFNGCTNLSYVKCLATNISANNCLTYWLSGVSSTGTFVKAANTQWPSGASGIPDGWTVETPINGYENGYEWVDLGLPSGLKWATCNVGASTPTGNGNHFAWGEITPKSEYSMSTYKYYNGGVSYDITKYNTDSDFGTVDNKTSLELVDDAARNNWGGKWRMPTHSEFDELMTNCSWYWTTQNGQNGYELTSKINSKTVFFPAAGAYQEKGYNGSESGYIGNGETGFYWTSTLFTDYTPSAYALWFSSSTNKTYTNIRFIGMSIRPVVD